MARDNEIYHCIDRRLFLRIQLLTYIVNSLNEIW